MQEPNLGLIANHLYTPSYVSLKFALRYYGLIPEQVNIITNITTNHTRRFDNAFGTFTYYGVGHEYFAVGITSHIESERTYLIATPEKALIDKLVFTSYIPTSVCGLQRFLEEDMRFDTSTIKQLNIPLTQECMKIAPKRTIIQNLITLCQR